MNRLIKSTTFFMLSIFTMTTIVWSQPDAVYRIKVDETYGNVTQRYKGDSDKTIIHIQDAHGSFEAQKNIASIINDLVSSDTTDVVGVEGALGTVDMSPYRAFPVTEARDAAAARFMKAGKFTGAEYAAVVSDKPLPLYGIEDKDLFLRNLKEYYQTSLKHEDILDSIEEIENALQHLKTPVFNADLMSFDSLVSSYESGAISMIDIAPTLFECMARYELEDASFVSLAQLREIISLEMRLDRSDAEQEKEALVSIVTEHDGAYIDQSISEAEEVQYIKNRVLSMGISLKRYVQFSMLCEYNSKYSRIDIQALAEEVEKVAFAICMKQAQNQNERRLIQYTRMVKIFKSVIGVTATRKEALHFLSHQNAFSLDSIYAFLRETGMRYGLTMNVHNSTTQINKVLAEAITFYENAQKRDHVLVENVLRAMENDKSDTGVLLSGGFHSEGIIEELQGRDLNYLTVMPQMSSAITDIPYADKMTGKLMPFSEAMASYIHLFLSAANTAGVATDEEIQKLQEDFNVTGKTTTFFLDNRGMILEKLQDAYPSDAALIEKILASVETYEKEASFNADEMFEKIKDLFSSYPDIMRSVIDYVQVMNADELEEEISEGVWDSANNVYPAVIIGDDSDVSIRIDIPIETAYQVNMKIVEANLQELRLMLALVYGSVEGLGSIGDSFPPEFTDDGVTYTVLGNGGEREEEFWSIEFPFHEAIPVEERESLLATTQFLASLIVHNSYYDGNSSMKVVYENVYSKMHNTFRNRDITVDTIATWKSKNPRKVRKMKENISQIVQKGPDSRSKSREEQYGIRYASAQIINASEFNDNEGEYVMPGRYSEEVDITTPLWTSSLGTCSALLVVDKTRGKHQLLHCSKVEELSLMNKKMEKINFSDPNTEIYFMRGYYSRLKGPIFDAVHNLGFDTEKIQVIEPREIVQQQGVSYQEANTFVEKWQVGRTVSADGLSKTHAVLSCNGQVFLPGVGENARPLESITKSSDDIQNNRDEDYVFRRELGASLNRQEDVSGKYVFYINKQMLLGVPLGKMPNDLVSMIASENKAVELRFKEHAATELNKNRAEGESEIMPDDVIIRDMHDDMDALENDRASAALIKVFSTISVVEEIPDETKRIATRYGLNDADIVLSQRMRPNEGLLQQPIEYVFNRAFDLPLPSVFSELTNPASALTLDQYGQLKEWNSAAKEKMKEAINEMKKLDFLIDRAA